MQAGVQQNTDRRNIRDQITTKPQSDHQAFQEILKCLFHLFLTMHIFFGNGNKKRQVRVAALWLSGISGRIRTSYRSFGSKEL